MNINKQTIGFLAVSAALLLLAGVLFFKPMFQAQGADVYRSVAISQATTTASFSVTTSVRVLATTTNTVGDGSSSTRIYATICNQNANPVTLLMDKDKPADLSKGRVTAVIAAAAGYSACYEVTDRNMYQGSITASSTNQTATVITVSDYTF